MKTVSRIVLPPVTKNVFYYAVIAPTSVHYVPVLKQGVLDLGQSYTLYVPKFAKHVPLNAQNTLHITLLVKSAPKPVKNVLQFAKNLQLLKHN